MTILDLKTLKVGDFISVTSEDYGLSKRICKIQEVREPKHLYQILAEPYNFYIDDDQYLLEIHEVDKKIDPEKNPEYFL